MCVHGGNDDGGLSPGLGIPLARAWQWRRQSERIKLIENYFLTIFEIIIVRPLICSSYR